MMKQATVLLSILLILGLTTMCLASEDIPALVKQAMPSVVLIKTYDSQGNELGLGSGFIINNDGDVVTCYHVMKGYSKAVVNTSDGKEFQVKNIIAINKSNDLVRMSLSVTGHNFTNLELNTTTEVGQEIIVIGGPLGLENTVSQGIVSAIRENKTQITAPISPGSSGGPVLNMNGGVIGMVSSQMINGQNLNFAIPAKLISTMRRPSTEQIKELSESLLHHESGPLGPYKISFDMNTTSKYKVIVDPPTSGVTSDGTKFTRYFLSVDGDDGYASFIVTGYDKKMSAGIDDNTNIVTKALKAIGCDSPKLYPSTVAIDGRRGILGNCKSPSGEGIIVMSYSPDEMLENGIYAGKTDCRFVSTYSWDVTRDMLATLHVEVP